MWHKNYLRQEYNRTYKAHRKNDYPNCQTQKDLFKDAEKVFEEMTANEDKEKAKSHIIKEILHLLSNEKDAQ